MSVRKEAKARLWQEVGDKREIEIKPPHSPRLSQAARGLRGRELSCFCFRFTENPVQLQEFPCVVSPERVGRHSQPQSFK